MKIIIMKSMKGLATTNVELSERAWEAFYTSLSSAVTVCPRQGIYPLASEDFTEFIDQRLIRKREERETLRKN
jgi:hypothetical protein